MKRLFVIPLVGVMLAILAVPVLAEGNGNMTKIDQDGGITNIDVYGSYEPDNATIDVYSVDITWGSMQAVYAPNARQIWDPESHTYKPLSEGNNWIWKGSSTTELKPNEVKIVNHSNKVVNCTVSFQTLVDTLQGEFTNGGTATLSSGSFNEGNFSEAVMEKLTSSFFLTLSGSISSSRDDPIGTISVSINQQNND